MLSIVVGTYNRLDRIKACIASIQEQTKCPHKIYIADAGSDDGTVEYLRSIASASIIPVLHGRKLGQAFAYNDIFFHYVDTPYVCWLSDDNVVVDGGLDVACRILQTHPEIGLVSLKTRDVQGPFRRDSYVGGISSIGILNTNQGVLPTALLRELGGFDEEFRDYGIDPDLTAKVLFAGHAIVYTKQVALHHFRDWPDMERKEEYSRHKRKTTRANDLYKTKYSERISVSFFWKIKQMAYSRLNPFLTKFLSKSAHRTFMNSMNCRYISIFDALRTRTEEYHLLQQFDADSFVSKCIMQLVLFYRRQKQRFRNRIRTHRIHKIHALSINDQALAGSVVHGRPVLSAQWLAILLFPFVKVKERLHLYLVWNAFTRQAQVDDSVLLSSSAKIQNLTRNPRAVRIGADSMCCGTIRVDPGGSVRIGKAVYIGDGVVIHATAPVSIGNRTTIARDVKLFNGQTRPFPGGKIPTHRHYGPNPATTEAPKAGAAIRIGCDCLLSPGSMVLRGCSVGNRSVIGANIEVTSPVPPDVEVGPADLRCVSRPRSGQGPKTAPEQPDKA
jgi:GT2 family glycosyltransferase/acetyltransferase-like isoleucine patch superfamily enzyme